jgi:REP element-mobilizing transposase RayT
MRQLSLDEARRDRGRGGLRTGAGRRPIYARPPVHHVRRPAVSGRYPCHVRLRVREPVPSLRSRRFLVEFRRALRGAAERGSFRVVHYSVQRTHVHLLVEAAGKQALGRGMKAVATRFAFCVQRVFGLRGRVLFGRYWLRILRTPREVRNALAYVLLNSRKHFFERRRLRPPVLLDEGSSARHFDGWRWLPPPPAGAPLEPRPEVAPARTWLLAVGWRRHRLIDPAEVPGALTSPGS